MHAYGIYKPTIAYIHMISYDGKLDVSHSPW